MMHEQQTLYLRRLPLHMLINFKVISRTKAYDLRKKGKLKFYYLDSTPWIELEELYESMTDKPE